MKDLKNIAKYNYWKQLVIFECISIISCIGIIFAVYLQTFVFYVFRPSYIEPILLTTMMVLTISGWMILLRPKSKWNSFLILIVVIVSILISIILKIWKLSYIAGLVVALITTSGVFVIKKYIDKYKLERIKLRIILSCLLFLMSLLILFIADRYFIIDYIG